MNAVFEYFADAWTFARCWVRHYKRWEWGPDNGGSSAYCPDCRHEWWMPG
jgi:hypothetical protein